MYAVKEGQSEVVKVLLEEENVDILTINKVRDNVTVLAKCSNLSYIRMWPASTCILFSYNTQIAV